MQKSKSKFNKLSRSLALSPSRFLILLSSYFRALLLSSSLILLFSYSRVLSLLSFFKRERGVTLAFTMIVLSNMLLIATAIGIFSINQLKITASARDSAYAIFAATTGLERAFYQVRKNSNCGNIGETTLVTDLKYSVNVTSTNCPNNAIATSVGTYKQTSRKIEASW